MQLIYKIDMFDLTGNPTVLKSITFAGVIQPRLILKVFILGLTIAVFTVFSPFATLFIHCRASPEGVVSCLGKKSLVVGGGLARA